MHDDAKRCVENVGGQWCARILIHVMFVDLSSLPCSLRVTLLLRGRGGRTRSLPTNEKYMKVMRILQLEVGEVASMSEIAAWQPYTYIQPNHHIYTPMYSIHMDDQARICSYALRPTFVCIEMDIDSKCKRAIESSSRTFWWHGAVTFSFSLSLLVLTGLSSLEHNGVMSCHRQTAKCSSRCTSDADFLTYISRHTWRKVYILAWKQY